MIALGGNTFHICARSKNYFRFRKELKAVFESTKGSYDAFWMNVCSLANIDYLIFAKKYGIGRRILHSHNSQNMDSGLRGLLHAYNKARVARYATDFWACSKDAACWFFKDSLQSKVLVIHNAIDAKRLAFDAQKRQQVRKQLGWEKNFIIGNVGRLHFQKNQMFVLDVFRQTIQKIPEARLVLVGQGEDENLLKEKARDYQIQDYVYFAGVQNDIGGWLSAFDLFLFPSRFEGFGLAAIEAEANGLMVLASEKVIPEEIKFNKNCRFYALDNNEEAWSQMVLSMKTVERRIPPKQAIKNLSLSGYSISTESKKFEEILLKDNP